MVQDAVSGTLAPHSTDADGGPTVHAGAVVRLARQLDALGLPAHALLLEAGVERVHLRGEARVPRSSFVTAKTLAARHAKDPCLGFRLGASTVLDDFELYGAAIEQSETLGEALELGARFLSVWEQGSRVEIARGPDRTRVRYIYRHADALTEQIESQHSLLFVAGAVATAAPGAVRDACLRFACPAPAHAVCLRASRSAGMSVRFDAPAWELEIANVALSTPLRRAHPAARRLVRAQLEREHAELRAETPLRARLRAAIAHGLPLGAALRDVAAALGLPARTLQLHLEAAGLTYRAEVALVRVEEALALLEASELPVSAVAERVGFSGTAAFTRFVRARTGRTPSDLRAGRARSSRP